MQTLEKGKCGTSCLVTRRATRTPSNLGQWREQYFNLLETRNTNRLGLKQILIGQSSGQREGEIDSQLQYQKKLGFLKNGDWLVFQ